MAEILTESFCERCGSRYTFESAVPRARLRGVKVLSRGLKNFVLDDKTSIDEAMAAARDDTDRSLTSQQLEAFHKTFNFCMQCRQYICPNCWNDGEGRCLTCAPTLGRGILAAPFPHLDPSAGIVAAPENGLAAAALNGHAHAADETNGNGFDALARLDALAPTAPTELVGASEIEARDATEPAVIGSESAEPTVGVVAATDVESSAAAVLEAPVAEPEAERFIYDPYDPPPPAPPKAIKPEVFVAAAAIAAEPEVVEAIVAPEPEVAESVVAPEAKVTSEASVAPEAEVVAEAVVESVVAPEAEVVADAVVAPAEETLAAQNIVVKAETAAPSDEVEADAGHAAALAVETSLLLAGLQPGQSLDEALAAFDTEPATDATAEPDVAETPEAADAAIVTEAADELVDEPTIDHPEVVAARLAAIAWTPERKAQIQPEPVAAVEPEPEPVAAVEPEAETPVFVDTADTIPAAPDDILVEATAEPAEAMLVADAPLVDEPVEALAEPIAAVEPLDDILISDSVAFEPAVDVQPEAEPEAAWQAEPLDDIVPVEVAALESVVETQPEPATPEPIAAEPAAIEAAPEPAAPPAPEPAEIAAAAADDVVAQPTWSILAPDPRPVTEVPGPLADGPAPTIEPIAPAASAEPNWPTQPQWPGPQPSAGLPFLGRPIVPTGGVDALWAESNQAVSAPRTGTDKPVSGVQPCTSCGLSLSASARFCRRCGTSQV